MSSSSDNPLVSNQVGYQNFNFEYEKFIDIFEREHKKYVDAINSKENGLYYPSETSTFQQYQDENNTQNLQNVYRKLIFFGTLPNTSQKRVPHNINYSTKLRATRIYGVSNNLSSLSMIPLPFASPTLANNVSLEVDSRDVIITTGSDRTSYTNTTVVIEYIKG